MVNTQLPILQQHVPIILSSQIFLSFSVLAVLTVISYSSPIFIAMIIPIAMLFCILQTLYIKTARQLQRLESAAQSPIYSKLTETLSGLMTIRSYSMQEKFKQSFYLRIDEKQTCSYMIIVTNKWRLIRMECKWLFYIRHY